MCRTWSRVHSLRPNSLRVTTVGAIIAGVILSPIPPSGVLDIQSAGVLWFWDSLGSIEAWPRGDRGGHQANNCSHCTCGNVSRGVRYIEHAGLRGCRLKLHAHAGPRHPTSGPIGTWSADLPWGGRCLGFFALLCALRCHTPYSVRLLFLISLLRTIGRRDRGGVHAVTMKHVDFLERCVGRSRMATAHWH